MAVAHFPPQDAAQPPLRHQQTPTRANVLCASVAGVVISGPLLAMMGFALLASITTFLFSWPLLLIFSPVILPAGFLLCTTVWACAAAAFMAAGGVLAFAWMFRCVGGGRGLMKGVREGEVRETVTESGQRGEGGAEGEGGVFGAGQKKMENREVRR